MRLIPWLILAGAMLGIFVGFGWFQVEGILDETSSYQVEHAKWVEGDAKCIYDNACDLYKWEKANPEPITSLSALLLIGMIEQTIAAILLLSVLVYWAPENLSTTGLNYANQ